jgi:thioredoxin reductase
MQNPTVQTDVIIVGAEPTGLSLAVQLMRYNIDFVIFDRKEGVTELSKALKNLKTYFNNKTRL